MYCHVTCMSTKVCACWLYIGIETRRGHQGHMPPPPPKFSVCAMLTLYDCTCPVLCMCLPKSKSLSYASVIPWGVCVVGHYSPQDWKLNKSPCGRYSCFMHASAWVFVWQQVCTQKLSVVFLRINTKLLHALCIYPMQVLEGICVCSLHVQLYRVVIACLIWSNRWPQPIIVQKTLNHFLILYAMFIIQASEWLVGLHFALPVACYNTLFQWLPLISS